MYLMFWWHGTRRESLHYLLSLLISSWKKFFQQQSKPYWFGLIFIFWLYELFNFSDEWFSLFDLVIPAASTGSLKPDYTYSTSNICSRLFPSLSRPFRSPSGSLKELRKFYFMHCSRAVTILFSTSLWVCIFYLFFR